MSSDALDSLGFAIEESDTAKATWRGTAEHLVEHYPDVLLAALAEAGVLRVEKCCDQAWREMRDFGGTRIYTCDGPCERYQYRTEWRPADE